MHVCAKHVGNMCANSSVCSFLWKCATDLFAVVYVRDLCACICVHWAVLGAVFAVVDFSAVMVLVWCVCVCVHVYFVCTINSAICPCKKYVCVQGRATVCTTRVASDAIRACPKVTRERACALACTRGMEACASRLERVKESRHTETHSLLPNPYSLNT